jgi:hypothetical protein
VRLAAISVGRKGIGDRGRPALPSVTEFSSSFRGSGLMAGVQPGMASRQITVDAALLVLPFGDDQEPLRAAHEAWRTTSSLSWARGAGVFSRHCTAARCGSDDLWPHSAQTRIKDEEGPQECRHHTGVRHSS